jgi:hypothetical protein
MSIARLAARIGGFLAVFAVVIAAYNFGAYLLVQNVISQIKKGPPFPTNAELQTSFEFRDFKGIGDDLLYKPGRFGDR